MTWLLVGLFQNVVFDWFLILSPMFLVYEINYSKGRILEKNLWTDSISEDQISNIFNLKHSILFLNFYFSSVLIDFASADDSRYQWQGYIVALMMFICQMIKSVLFNFSFWSSQIVGMQMKTMLIAAIYKKVSSLL